MTAAPVSLACLHTCVAGADACLQLLRRVRLCQAVPWHRVQGASYDTLMEMASAHVLAGPQGNYSTQAVQAACSLINPT